MADTDVTINEDVTSISIPSDTEIIVTEDVMPGVVQLSTGAWYDPLVPGEIGSVDVHGNPNVLTIDKGTSKLAQGPSAMSALVEVELFEDELPPIKIFSPPEIIESA